MEDKTTLRELFYVTERQRAELRAHIDNPMAHRVPPESLAVTLGVHCMLGDGLSCPREGVTQPHLPGVLPFFWKGCNSALFSMCEERDLEMKVHNRFQEPAPSGTC